MYIACTSRVCCNLCRHRRIVSYACTSRVHRVYIACTSCACSGRAEKSLEGLRRRVLNLFLQFIETPEFNPEAARFQKVPRELLNNPNVLPLGKSTADDASAASTVRA